jgi:hypothetical protein
VAWIVRLVNTGADGEKQSADVMKIDRPDDLSDIAKLGLSLAEGKLLLAGLQQEIVAAQAKGHAVRRPDCQRCGEVCRVKDYTGTMRPRRFSARSRCGFPAFAVPGAEAMKLAMVGPRIAGRRRSWTSFRRISPL